jgi:small subunit ribosomal protein S2
VLDEKMQTERKKHKGEKMPFNVTIKQLLEAGVHFGHQTKRWNPKMKPYIYGARNGIYIVDLQKSLPFFKKGYEKIVEITRNGGEIIFIATKKQAASVIIEEAKRCNMHYVTERWLGGMLTNFSTIRKSIERLNDLEALKESEEFSKFTKKEMTKIEKDIEKLQSVLNGIRNMDKVPAGVFIVDTHREIIAVKEASKLGIPIIGIVDTNSDPESVDYIIPGNDDAIRSIRLIASNIADAVLEGRALYEARLNRSKVSAAADVPGIKEETFTESAPQEVVLENADGDPSIGDPSINVSL